MSSVLIRPSGFVDPELNVLVVVPFGSFKSLSHHLVSPSDTILAFQVVWGWDNCQVQAVFLMKILEEFLAQRVWGGFANVIALLLGVVEIHSQTDFHLEVDRGV